jgi:hypothetical protein
LVDFKSQSVESIDPLFDDDLNDVNPAVDVEIAVDHRREVFPASIDEATGAIEPAIVTLEQFPEVESSETEPMPSGNVNNAGQKSKKRIVQKKRKPNTNVIVRPSSLVDSDSEFFDSNERQPPAKRRRQTHQSSDARQRQPKATSCAESSNQLQASSSISNQSKDDVVDEQPSVHQVESSDTDSFLNHIGSAHADQFGFIRFGPNVPNNNNRRCVLPARPSCDSCALVFGDSDCCFKFCEKCCRRWAKQHKNHACDFHGI